MTVKRRRGLKTPAEVAVDAELQINAVTQYVRSLNECLGDMEQPERILAALAALRAEIGQIVRPAGD